MGQVFVLYGVGFGSQLDHYFLHLDGVSDDHDVREQVKATNDRVGPV